MREALGFAFGLTTSLRRQCGVAKSL